MNNVKLLPTSLIANHFRTYRDASSGKHLLSDHLLFEGIPIAVLVVAWVAHAKIPANESSALLVVSAVMFALMLTVLAQLSHRIKSLIDTRERTQAYADEKLFLGEVVANVGYTSLVALLSSVLFAVSASVGGVATALSLAMGVYLVLLLLMVLKRTLAIIGHDLRQ